MDNDFLGHRKYEQWKKTVTLDLVKIQLFCSLNANIKKTKNQTTYLKILPKYIAQMYSLNMYLANDMFLEYIKNT